MPFFLKIWNYKKKIQKQFVKFGKIYIFCKIHIYSTTINIKHEVYWSNYLFLITNYKRFHSKILSYEKMKGLKKNSQFFFKYFHWLLWMYLYFEFQFASSLILSLRYYKKHFPYWIQLCVLIFLSLLEFFN